MKLPPTFDKLRSVRLLDYYYKTELSKRHLKDLLNDAQRNEQLRVLFDPKKSAQLNQDGNCLFDFTHCKLDLTAKELLLNVAKELKLKDRIQA